MKRGIKIRQHDITDCGAACLASVAAYYGLRMPIARIRQYASTNQRGTNILGLVEASHKLGFQAKGVKGSIESLQKIPKPAIAHVIIKESLQHYIVIYKTTPHKITVMDPGDGRMHTYTIEEFKKIWTGNLLILLPDDDFEAKNEEISKFSRFAFLLRPHSAILIQSIVGALVYTILGLTTSIYVEKIVDNVLPETNYNLMNLLGV
jgi:ATP-binding cassette subfamily B protein